MKKSIILIISILFSISSYAQFTLTATTQNDVNNSIICEIYISASTETYLGNSDFKFSYTNKLSNPVRKSGIASVKTSTPNIIIVNVLGAGFASPVIKSTPTLLASLTFNNVNNNSLQSSDFTCLSQLASYVDGEENDVRTSVNCSSAYISALPITLLKFDARPASGGNLLTWQTASEINASHFEIERSDDGKSFEKIGAVKAQGKAGNYEFIDKQAQVATVYYRLKNMDLDGTFAYSNVVSINNSPKELTARVFPNPFSEDLNIQVFTEKKQNLTIEVLDILGRQIYLSKTKDTEGVVNLPVSTKSLPNGTYFLKISDGIHILREKIIKQL